MPSSVGVPIMVMVFDAQLAVTPAGRPEAAPIPIAPVVVRVIAISSVLIHRDGSAEASPAVLSGSTIIVPSA